MNELQIRLSGDISALQAALTKAKATIKSFESETEKESEKGNVGFKRKIGLIEQLTNKAKALRTALSQATNETQIAKYNAELEQTSQELTRLNALGRSVSANLGSTASGFGQVARQGANANGVAIEFNRVIQDAPFGLIGIGNNLQQLAGNFQQVAKSAGGTGAAIKASLASIISPVNLGLLAISALTAGFTAYQMGAFDGIFATRDFAKELEEFKESLSAVDSARLEGIGNADKELVTLNSLRGIIDSETTSRKAKLDAVKQLQELYPAYFGNLTQEQILAGDLTKTYEALTKTIIAKAQAEASVSKFIELAQEERLILQKTAEDRARIAEFEQKALLNQQQGQKELQTINENQVRFLQSKLKPELDRINEIKEEQKTLEQDITKNLIDANAVLTTQKSIVSDVKNQADGLVRTYEQLNVSLGDILQRAALERRDEFFQGVEAPLARRESGQQITQGVIIPDLPVDEFEEQGLKIQEVNRAISDSFSALGVAIASNLDIQNDAVKGFVSTVLSNAPKIIQAVFATAQANKVAAASNIATAKKGALANGIFMATETGKSLGPIGLALLPVLIGGALALISSAFNGGSGGGSSIPSSASASTGAPPQIFTNSQIPRPPGSSAPTPTGNIDFGNAQGRLEARIDGGDIVFVYDRYKERQRGGG